ncbi:MAG TPA: hypothetical protein VM100_12580 [Longimicrobiales bacterium]|nr:hypothetical protein [Longimicrobiales bacterium]
MEEERTAEQIAVDDENKRAQKAFVGSVRQGDIEPYTALRWLGTLFKSAAVFLMIAILGEFVAGVRFEGMRAMPVLLGEMARTMVLAVVLWGTGDIVRLAITVGNDIRASRILMARLVFRTPEQKKEDAAIGEVPREVLDPHFQDEGAAAD